MEMVKGVIFDRGQCEVRGAPCKRYLVAFQLVTDGEIDLGDNSEVIVINGSNLSELTEALQKCDRFQPPYRLGSVEPALMSASELDPEDLERLE